MRGCLEWGHVGVVPPREMPERRCKKGMAGAGSPSQPFPGCAPSLITASFIIPQNRQLWPCAGDLIWKGINTAFPASGESENLEHLVSHLLGSSSCLNITGGSGLRKATGSTGAFAESSCYVICQALDCVPLWAKQEWSSGSCKSLGEHKHWPKYAKWMKN